MIKQFLTLVQANQYTNALQFAQHPSIIDSKQPQVLQARAMTYLNTGHERQARDAFLDLLTFVPNQDGIHNVVADLSSKLGEYGLAEHHFGCATRLKPNVHQYWFNWGLSYVKQAQHLNAIKSFQKCLFIDPQFDKARIELAKVCVAQGSFSLAETELKSLFTKFKQDTDWKWHLLFAQCLESKHQYIEAESHYLMGLDKTETENVLYEGLALLALKQKDNAKAIQWLERGLVQLPTDRLLLRLVTRLKHETYDLTSQNDIDPLSHYKTLDNSILPNGVKLDFVNHYIVTGEIEQAKSLISRLKLSSQDKSFESLESGIAIKEKDFNKALSLSSAHLSVNDSQFETFADYAILAHFALGDYQSAGQLIDLLLKIQPGNQYYWGLKSTELKLTDEESYQQMMNFHSLLNYSELAISNEYRSVSDFNEQLIHGLKSLHTTVNSPLEQSGRGGTQTPGFLFDHDLKVIQDLRLFLTKTATEQLSKLADYQHSKFPIPKSFCKTLEIVTAWSMWLNDGGYHRAHCHPKGWFSSAYYVQTPKVIKAGSMAGNITFGRPGFDTYDKLDFDRNIVPKSGYLALFPSFYWHSTEPFSDDSARVTVAFDMLTK